MSLWIGLAVTSLTGQKAEAADSTSSNAKKEYVAEKPNILLIIGDDISAEVLDCYGNPGIKTLVMDGFIDYTSLLNSLGLNSIEELKQLYPKSLDESLFNNRTICEEKWSN